MSPSPRTTFDRMNISTPALPTQLALNGISKDRDDQARAVLAHILDEVIIDEEEAVEEASFADSGNLLISGGVQHEVAIAIGVTPAAVMVVGGTDAKQRDEVHSALGHCLPSLIAERLGCEARALFPKRGEGGSARANGYYGRHHGCHVKCARQLRSGL